jgi:hypothetical protein
MKAASTESQSECLSFESSSLSGDHRKDLRTNTSALETKTKDCTQAADNIPTPGTNANFEETTKFPQTTQAQTPKNEKE